MSERIEENAREVPQANYLEARHFFEALDVSEGLLQRAVRCSKYHSSRVEYPQLTRKFVPPALVGLFMALQIAPREFCCLNYQFMWRWSRRSSESSTC